MAPRLVTILLFRSAGRAHGRRAATRRRSGRRSLAGSGGSSPSARCPRPGSRQPVLGSRSIRPPGLGRPCRPRSCSRSRRVDVRPGRSGLWHRLRQACNHAPVPGPPGREGSKPSVVSSNRRPGCPKGRSASWERASRLLLVVMVQFLVIETSGQPGVDWQLILSVGA